MLNSELIKFVEATPDTLITLSPVEEKIMVKESVEEVVKQAIEYKKKWLWTPIEHRKT